MDRSRCAALFMALLAIAPPLLAQSVVEFAIPKPSTRPYGIARGHDGAMWFTVIGSRSIGRISAEGAIIAYPSPAADEIPFLLTASGGILWYTFTNSASLGTFVPGGGVALAKTTASGGAYTIEGIAEAPGGALWLTTSDGRVLQWASSRSLVQRADAVPANGGPAPSLAGIVQTADGRIWFADHRAGRPRIGWMIAGFLTSFFNFIDLPPDSIPWALVAGDNGSVWFTDRSGYVGRISREGVVRQIVVQQQSDPQGIARAADGTIWFTETGANRIGRIDPVTLALTEIDIPTPNSRPTGIAAGPDNVVWFTEHGANNLGRIGNPLPPAADLDVSIVGPGVRTDDDPTISSFLVTIRNRGEEQARDVSLNVESSQFLYEGIPPTSSQGTCSITPSGTPATFPTSGSCNLGVLPAGGVVAARFSLLGGEADFSYEIFTDAHAATTSTDRNLGNNHAHDVSQFVNCGRSNCLFYLYLTGICKSAVNALQVAGTSRRSKSLIRKLADEVGLDLNVFYSLRDEVFARTAAGRRYTELYYANGLEISRLLLLNPSVGAQALDTLRTWQEPLRALVEGRGSSVTISAAQIASLQTALGNLKSLGSVSLRGVIEAEETKLQLSSLTGQTMDQALARQTATAPRVVTLPAAASLHGIPPAFFHSDVRVFNPASSAVDVTARYRCFTGSCGNSVQTFTVAPGEMKIFDDMVARQFGASESGGAIEFEGDVIVDSRLYTPEAGNPTTGMYVPALTAGSAYAESVLLSLSHSADPSRGFRTNVGAYNPNDVPLDVLFTVYDRLGREIGRTTRSLPARTPVQVNNIFAVVGAAGDFDGAYCVIRADGVREIFAYASVIDNRSTDLIFVTGKNRKRGVLGTGTLAAAASLHGIPPTFFHSDVTVFNPSATDTAQVVARYRCFLGACAAASTTFDVAPGQARVFEDAVVALFGAPETGGAIEFTGPVVVDSRLYTPSRPAPSTGMYIPAGEEQDAHAESVLLSLSHAVDQSRGFRTNAGAYNPNPVALDVTFTLFDPTGKRLGEVIRSVPPLTPVQVNNVFAVAGITVDVPSAYCVVRADGIHPLFAFASVIDNRSQDLIFVRGSRRGGS